MSLMKTLAKVAIGIAVAKGVSSLAKGASGQTRTSGGGGMFGGAHSPSGGQDSGGGGGLQDILGNLTGDQTQRGSSGGGLQDILGSLTGGGAQSGGAGGLQDALGGILSGRGMPGGSGSSGASTQAGGGLGGLIDQLAGGAGGLSGGTGGFGEKLNDMLVGGEPPAPSRQEEDAAALMLSAMIQAAKSDGKVDEAERAKLLDQLGDLDQAEVDFVNGELQKPMDVEGLARSVPQGLEQSVYMMSIMGIDLDNQSEAQYLHQLASAMQLPRQTVNDIHARLGVPALYS